MIQHHKNLSLDLLLPNGLAEDSSGSLVVPAAAAAAAAPAPTQPAAVRPRPTSRKARSTDVLDDLERQDQQQRLADEVLCVDGRRAVVRLTAAGIEWTPLPKRASAAAATAVGAAHAVPFSEMLAVQRCEPRAASLLLPPCLRSRLHRLAIFTFARSPKRRCEWAPRKLVLESASDEAVQDWAAAIGSGIEAAALSRPKNLLVVLNPNSGHRAGGRAYRRLVAPVFAAAGIRATVRQTRHAGHASEIVAQLSLEQLRGMDGIVCVGGDGVFHEAINGLLQARAAAEQAGAAGAELAAALSALRLAHIPAGSTDAVACTLHGSRSAFTAAMHVCLGDSTQLDVLRVDTALGTKFASCVAAYGFLADVTSTAEAYRWLGPLRYDLVGAAKLLAGRSYPARVRYLEGEVGRELSRHARSVCGAGCTVCRTASFLHSRRHDQQQLAAASAPPLLSASPVVAANGSGSTSQQGSPRGRGAGGVLHGAALPLEASCSSLGSLGIGSEPQSPVQRGLSSSSVAAAAAASPHYALPAADAAERQGGEEWQEIEGEWSSIMCICMPCRSDKTRSGMARYAHLADGRLKLVLVRKCSPLQYLRFLMYMSRHGCAPRELPYVTVLDAVAVQVQPLVGSTAGLAATSLVSSPLAAAEQGQQLRPSGAAPRVSCWNLDGELVRGGDMAMAAEVHHGLLRVFSRGVEL